VIDRGGIADLGVSAMIEGQARWMYPAWNRVDHLVRMKQPHDFTYL